VRNNNGKRLAKLEQLFAATTDEVSTLHVDPDLTAIVDEYGSMKSQMGDKSSRGGVPIEPVNVALDFYGRPYSQREFRELAIARALEKRGYSAAEIAERMEAHLALLEEGGRDEHMSPNWYEKACRTAGTRGGLGQRVGAVNAWQLLPAIRDLYSCLQVIHLLQTAVGVAEQALLLELHGRSGRRGRDRRGRRGGAYGLVAMEGSMSEAELDRLRLAVERLMNGQKEALEVIAQALEESEGIEQDKLVDVQDILEGAYEDAQNILDDSEGSEE